MKKPNSFLLVYGSETGQAKAIAEQIAEKCPDFGLSADLHCLDETGKAFNLEEETCMVLVTSTTGDGDAPDNASKFLRRIKKRTLPPTYLSHLHYAILGLGDTNYNQFCKCGRDMDSRLEQLGATRFYPTGLADDGVGLEVVADPWLEGLYPALKKFLGGEECEATASLTEKIGALEVPTCDSEIKENSNKNSEKNENSNRLSHKPKQSELNGDHAANENNSADSAVAKNGDGEKTGDSNSNVSVDKIPSRTSGKSDVDFVQNTQSSDPSETPCVKIDVLSLMDSEAGVTLSKSSPTLEGKDLTVPVLAPEFLQALFSEERVDTRTLSFQNGCKLPSSLSDIMTACVCRAQVLTQPGSVKKTLRLRLKVKEQDNLCSPGDSISVVCSNNNSEVEMLLARLDCAHLADQQMILSIIPNTKKRRAAVPPHIHPTTTLRHALKTCVSIRDPPSKAFLRVLIAYTTHDAEKRRLQELCSKEGAEEYTKCIREKCVSLLDVLYAFPSCNPPVERILEFLPKLLPRPYSICSCPEANPDSVEIVFNVVGIPGNVSEGRFYHRRGVCTGWLDDITSSLQQTENDDSSCLEIPIFFRSNQHFRPPTDMSKPLILIGPGTGVAPFIGFLQQRALQKQQADKACDYGETWLFTGCRNKDKDFLFREDLESFVGCGTLTKLCVSFSRDPDSQHRYVQDYMRSESASLARLVGDKEALVYVCGDAKNMAKDVNGTLQDILVSEKGFSIDEASSFIMKKRLHKTYLEDVWT